MVGGRAGANGARRVETGATELFTVASGCTTPPAFRSLATLNYTLYIFYRCQPARSGSPDAGRKMYSLLKKRASSFMKWVELSTT